MDVSGETADLVVKESKQGYLTEKGIEQMRSQLSNDIFQDELLSIYQEKDLFYQEVRDAAMEAMGRLIREMKSGLCVSPIIAGQMETLAGMLTEVKGKKVYGYLKKPVKAQVDAIVDELARLPEVAECYEQWNRLRDELERYYKDAPREHKPLSQQPEFKAIKNMVIREADNLQLGVFTFEDAQMKDEVDEDQDAVLRAWSSRWEMAEAYQNAKEIISEPKTKAANRTIILPPAMVELLAEYKKGIFSELMFPSRTKPEQPIDPGYVRKRLQIILERAGCKRVRFHDLRHTFATLSLENGMDVKTLSTIIGHVSSATTLNTYTHITDEMRRKAALNIDQGIAKAEVGLMPEQTDEPPKQDLVPIEPPRRRPGTGCVSQLREYLWEGRYSPVWPDGKKHSRNVYAKTRAECEEKLKVLILEMKAEIAALRSGASTEYPDGVSPKKKAIAAYLREHPGVSSKSLIARELQMGRSTVQRYYDEIRSEFQRQN